MLVTWISWSQPCSTSGCEEINTGMVLVILDSTYTSSQYHHGITNNNFRSISDNNNNSCFSINKIYTDVWTDRISAHHITQCYNQKSNLPINILNSNQNSLSSLSVNYIGYFYIFSPILIKNFPNLFSKSFITQIVNLKNYINCSLIKLKCYLKYFISSICSMTSNLSDIKSLFSLVTDLPGLIENVLDNLKTAIGLNITLLCLKMCNIDKSIKCCIHTLNESVKIICNINKFNTKCKIGIISCLLNCLNQIKSNLIQLQTDLCNLYHSYSHINCLIIETQNIIRCNNDILNLNSKTCRLIEEFKCSLTHFNTIESCIRCAKSIIDKLKEEKGNLCKSIQSNNQIITLKIKCDKKTIVSITNLKGLTDKIEKITSEFTIIDGNTIKLKHSLVFNSYYFQISSYILEQLECIESSYESIKPKTDELNKVSSEISVITDNINFVKSVIDKINECTYDFGYIRDSLCSIIPKLCEIKKGAESIMGLKRVSESLNKIKCSIENLKNLGSDDKCLQIFTDQNKLKYSFICIKDKLDINCVTGKSDIVNKSISSLESVISNNNNILPYIEKILCDIKYILGWIDELQNSVDNIVNRFIRCSLQTLSNHIMDKKSSDIVVPEMSNEVVNLISGIVIDESIFVVSSLYMYYKIKGQIFETLQTLKKCICLRIYNKNFNSPRTGLTLTDPTHINDNPHRKLYSNNKILNDRNNLCLCLVVRYLLTTDLYSIIRYNEHMYMDLLSFISRNYQKYSYSITHNFNSSKLIMLIVTTFDKIISWMNKIYMGDKIHCYCYDVNNPYYHYLISIILFLSSLIENIWILNNHNIGISIEFLSALIPIISQINDTKVGDGPRSSLSHLGFYDKQVTKHFNIVGSQLYISNSNLQLSITITDDYNKQIYKSDNHCSLLTKPFIQSLISSISNIRISGPKFNLFFQSFTFFSHYILIKSSYSQETKSWISEENKNISEMYLSINAKKTLCNTRSCDRKCCENVREKIVYYVICVARGKFRTLSRQITNTAIIKFIQQNNELKLYEIINVLNKLTISIITSILKTTKNNFINHHLPHINNKNTNLGNIRNSNWGYDTLYEHEVTADKSIRKSDIYPLVFMFINIRLIIVIT